MGEAPNTANFEENEWAHDFLQSSEHGAQTLLHLIEKPKDMILAKFFILVPHCKPKMATV